MQLKLILATAIVGAALALASSSSAAQLDTVTVTGSTGPVTPPVETHFGLVHLFDVNIDAHSGTEGQDPGGTASFTLGVPSIGGLGFSGSVSCLSVTGPDSGAGTSTEPTTAVLRFQDASGILVAVGVVDAGGNGADFMGFVEGSAPAPTGCSVSEALTPLETGTLTNGRAVVFDAPLLPTSKDQCKNGGWEQFDLKNQGHCIALVNHGP